jgi:hypothetical protein
MLNIGPAGDSITVQAAGNNGSLTLVVPPGAVTVPTDFEVVEIVPNNAPGASGGEYQVSAAGAVLALPFSLVFTPPPATPVDSLTAADQTTSGYWVRQYSVAREESAQTITVSSTYFGDWSLATIATAQDLMGPFRLDSTQGVPFTAEGNVTLQSLGTDGSTDYYLPTGTIAPDTPILSGTATCTVDAGGTGSLPMSIADLEPGVSFHWGINGDWNLSCDDGSHTFIDTNFDTLGITNIGCARRYIGTPIIDPTHLRGQYEIDCGGGNTVIASWDLVPAGQTPGPLPPP